MRPSVKRIERLMANLIPAGSAGVILDYALAIKVKSVTRAARLDKWA
jgi:hypothetical protein